MLRDQQLGDLHRFDEAHEEWTRVDVAAEPNGAFPAPRSEHACALVNLPSSADSEALLVFGGTDGSHALGDAFMLRLDADTLHWERLAATGATTPVCPPVAAGMTAHYIPTEGRVVLLGGRAENGSTPAGLCVLDLASMSWTHVDISGPFRPSLGHASAVIQRPNASSLLFVVGGRDQSKSHSMLQAVDLESWTAFEPHLAALPSIQQDFSTESEANLHPLPRMDVFGFALPSPLRSVYPLLTVGDALWCWGGKASGKAQPSDVLGLHLLTLGVAAGPSQGIAAPPPLFPVHPPAPSIPAPHAPAATSERKATEMKKSAESMAATSAPTREQVEQEAGSLMAKLSASMGRVTDVSAKLRAALEWAAISEGRSDEDDSLAPLPAAREQSAPSASSDKWATRCAAARALADGCARLSEIRRSLAETHSSQRRLAASVGGPLAALERASDQLARCSQGIESALVAMRGASDEQLRLAQVLQTLTNERDQQGTILQGLRDSEEQCADLLGQLRQQQALQDALHGDLRRTLDALKTNLTHAQEKVNAAAEAQAAAAIRVTEAEAAVAVARGPADEYDRHKASLEQAVSDAQQALEKLQRQQSTVEKLTRDLGSWAELLQGQARIGDIRRSLDENIESLRPVLTSPSTSNALKTLDRSAPAVVADKHVSAVLVTEPPNAASGTDVAPPSPSSCPAPEGLFEDYASSVRGLQAALAARIDTAKVTYDAAVDHLNSFLSVFTAASKRLDEARGIFVRLNESLDGARQDVETLNQRRTSFEDQLQTAFNSLHNLTEAVATQASACAAHRARLEAFLSSAETREDDISRTTAELERATSLVGETARRGHAVMLGGCPSIASEMSAAERLASEADRLRADEMKNQQMLQGERVHLEQARRAVADSWELF